MGLFDMFKKKAEPAAAAAPASISASAGADVLCSPVKGKVIKMADVPDPVFGGEVLGKGCAVWPEDDLVYAPCDGKVTVTMGHAVGLQSDSGIEVLVHVGVDTVNMNGDGFEGFVKADDVVKAGQPILKIDRAKIFSVGFNLSGRVNSKTGYSYSYFFVEEEPLTMLLEKRLGCKVYVENDTRAMTYGEYMCGVGNNEDTMIFVNASWGLGVGLVIDRKLFYGRSGFSGEFGHFPLLDNEVICRCGKRGCLETGASGSAVHRIFMEKLAQKRVSMLSDKYNRGEQILLEDILEALGQEDVLAIEVMETVGHTLGKAMAGLINLFNPDLIVLGGTLAVAKDYIMLPLKSAINKYSLQLVNKDTTIKLSKLGEKAGAVGACMLSRSKMLGLM